MNHSVVGAVAVAAFWLFVAIVSVAGMMYDYRKKQLMAETLRRAIDNGHKLDPAVLDGLISQQSSSASPQTVDPRHLRVGGIVTLSSGIGVFGLSFFVAQVAPIARYPIMGASVVVVCVAIGLLIAAGFVERGLEPGRHGDPRA